MAKLIYAAFTSLDGYVADETGNFDWAEPDEEVHAFINSRERQIGTYLFGRKMYETMAVWETPDELPPLIPAVLEYAPIWQAAEKIVYSTTLQTVSTAKTRLERSFRHSRRRSLLYLRKSTNGQSPGSLILLLASIFPQCGVCSLCLKSSIPNPQ